MTVARLTYVFAFDILRTCTTGFMSNYSRTKTFDHSVHIHYLLWQGSVKFWETPRKMAGYCKLTMFDHCLLFLLLVLILFIMK